MSSKEELKEANGEEMTTMAGEIAHAIRERGWTGVVAIVGRTPELPQSPYGVAGCGAGLDVMGDLMGTSWLLAEGLKTVKKNAPHLYDEMVHNVRTALSQQAPDVQGRHWEYQCRKCKSLIVTEMYGMLKCTAGPPFTETVCDGDLVMRKPR